MKHAALAALAILYAIIWGQNWTTYATALMLAAIHADYKHARQPPPHRGRTQLGGTA